MALKDREKKILEYLSQNREATIEELCALLFVSAPTVRRDLSSLSKSGRIIRTHGGAIFNTVNTEGTPQEKREKEFVYEKDIIARKCLDLINDGDTVMIDASSTALRLLNLLSEKRIIVVTNSTKASFVLAKTGIKTFVSGGEASKTSFGYVGSLAERFIRQFNADICFFSVSSLTPDGKLTDNSVLENQISKAMMEQSKKSVLLLNSQKIGAPYLNTVGMLSDVDLIVCEKDISDKFPSYKEKFI